MSGTTMRASVLLTLEDQLSGGLSRLTETLDRLDAAAKRLAGSFDHLHIGQPFEQAVAPIDRAGRAITGVTEDADKLKRALGGVVTEADQIGRAGEKLTGFQDRLRETARGVHEHLAPHVQRLKEFTDSVGPIGGAIAAASVIAPVEKYADYENILRHIAITEGLSGTAVAPEIDRLTTRFAMEARHTGQSSESIAKAFSELVQIGIPASILNRVIGTHSEAATAYNISPEALGPAVGALLQTMKVPEADIGPALAAMAQASKEGRFKVEDFSLEFPGVAGVLAGAGMHGRGGADYAFAALETVMRNSSQPAQGAADFRQALNYVFSPFAERFFKKQGIDLDASILAAGRHGINPMDAVLDLLTGMTKGLGPEQARMRLGTVLHNQEAGQAIFALLQHRGEFEALLKKLDAVSAANLNRDFQTALADPITTVRRFTENLAQATRALGAGFMPTMSVFTAGLGFAADLLKGANANFPILTTAAYTAAGALATLAAAAGAKSLVGDYVASGGRLLLGMVGGAAGAAGAGVGLLSAEYAHFLSNYMMRRKDDYPNAAPPPELRLHVTADPGLQVHRLGTGGERMTIGSPLGWADPSTTVLGRD